MKRCTLAQSAHQFTSISHVARPSNESVLLTLFPTVAGGRADKGLRRGAAQERSSSGEEQLRRGEAQERRGSGEERLSSASPLLMSEADRAVLLATTSTGLF